MLTLCVFMSIGAPTLVPLTTEKEWNITNYLDLKEEGDNVTGLSKADVISNEINFHHNGTAGNASKEESLVENSEKTDNDAGLLKKDTTVNEIHTFGYI